MRVVSDPTARNTFLSKGSFGWSGAFGTHFWVDQKEQLVAILMTQTANNEARGDFENAVMQAIVEPADPQRPALTPVTRSLLRAAARSGPGRRRLACGAVRQSRARERQGRHGRRAVVASGGGRRSATAGSSRSATSPTSAAGGPRRASIDLGGRTVIPGLIDSHLHAIRAALQLRTEVNWIGARVARPRRSAASRAAARSGRRPARWLIVAGGWTEQQFAEKRRPTQAELRPRRPSNPVYVQLGYGWVVMTDDGFTELGITSDADLPPGGGSSASGGKPTGCDQRRQAAIVALFDRLPKPTFDAAGRGHAARSSAS